MNQDIALQEVLAELEDGRLNEAADKCRKVLRDDPANVTAIGLYGDLAIALRRSNDAIVIFQKLLQVEPRHATAHSRLAALFQAQGDMLNADAHARTALDIDPLRAEPHLVLGSVLLSKERESEALEEFEKARSLARDYLDAESAYAEALLESGHFERAGELLRDLIARHPQESSFHYSLARSRKLRRGDADEALIRSLLDEQGNLRAGLKEFPDRSGFAYRALSKMESDLENHAEAFKYLSLANDIRIAEQPADTEFEHIFKTIRDLIDADFMQARKAFGCTATDPIFVVGMPRSGTTLLERVLASHPDVGAAGELPIVFRLKEEVCAQFGNNQYDQQALLKLPEPVWQQLGEEYIRRARRWGASEKHFVDKLPDNFVLLGFIKAMLPGARLVHISRHPVATCLSIFEQEFSEGHTYANDLRTLGLYYLAYLEQMNHWRSLFGDDIIEIDYEYLVADEAAASRWLFEQLGLTDDPRDLETSQRGGVIRTASLWQARQPVHSGSVARWHHYREQLKPLLEILAPVPETVKSDQ